MEHNGDRPPLPRQTLGMGQRNKGPAARAVGSYVPRLTRKVFEKYGFSASAILTDWASIVGEELALYTEPERLKWPRGVEAYGEVGEGGKGRPGATLVLRVDGSWALDVQFRSRQIIERINAYFGYRAVAEMRIVQAPVTRAAAAEKRAMRATANPAPEPLPEVEMVQDKGLRDALERFQAGLVAHRGKVVTAA